MQPSETMDEKDLPEAGILGLSKPSAGSKGRVRPALSRACSMLTAGAHVVQTKPTLPCGQGSSTLGRTRICQCTFRVPVGRRGVSREALPGSLGNSLLCHREVAGVPGPGLGVSHCRPEEGWGGIWSRAVAGSASAPPALVLSPSLAHLREWVLARSPSKACPARRTSSPTAPPKHDGKRPPRRRCPSHPQHQALGSPGPPEDTQHN